MIYTDLSNELHSTYSAPSIRICRASIERGFGQSDQTGGDIFDPEFDNESNDFWM